MKTVKAALLLLIFSFVPNVNAQQARVSNDTQVETKHSVSYYQQRGLEDAQYEQKFEAKSKTEERTFWEEQKQYEKELKKNDRRGHRAYLQGKKEGYATHHDHCDSHCHHSEYWYQHAGYYYYEYREPRYENRSSRTTVSTQIGVSTPKVRLGIF
ncbi:hypothetical protein SAMN05443667_113133 [Flavobacterium gillisiae]|uniref:Uncharacterized protein n=1 Tax=Flavobacterium gillisiae TaxID=150146 RepID=A0A1H4FKE8_9FLAO|nr:hypothetical protein [Flavobacterium gillisiae]SEA96962.1 hypothetical protein SAMN05443667_113133 [Flavobacterium gillisiae]